MTQAERPYDAGAPIGIWVIGILFGFLVSDFGFITSSFAAIALESRVMLYVYASLLVVLNTAWLVLVVLGLPGTWLMVLCTAGLAWWQWEAKMFGVPLLVGIVLLAGLGEVLEFVLGAAGSKKAGGTVWGSVGAIVGAVIGAIVGSFAIPIPVIGTIIGACAGAFAGAMGMEMLTGRKLGESVRSGQGAAVGRFYGTVSKLVVGIALWVIIAAAAFVP